MFVGHQWVGCSRPCLLTPVTRSRCLETHCVALAVNNGGPPQDVTFWKHKEYPSVLYFSFWGQQCPILIRSDLMSAAGIQLRAIVFCFFLNLHYTEGLWPESCIAIISFPDISFAWYVTVHRFWRCQSFTSHPLWAIMCLASSVRCGC